MPISQSHTTLAEPLELPRDVSDFCAKEELLPHLRMAMRLAAEVFSPAEEPRVELDTDHETGEQRAVISVRVRGTVDETLARYNDYTVRWVAAAPPHVICRIGLTFDFSQQ